MTLPRERTTVIVASDRSENADRASRLRTALETIQRDAPAGFEPDVVDIARRVGLMEVALLEHDVQRRCRRCGTEFTYDAARFARKHLPPPAHCYECRQARRRERRFSGGSAEPLTGD